MSIKQPKPRAGGRWTEAQYFQFIRNNLRWMWMKYPVNKAYKTERRIPNDGRFDKRSDYMYSCEICSGIFKGCDVQVDHIKPCGTLKTFEDLPRFVSTLFCEENNLRLLCKGCHQKITNEERTKK